MKGKTIGTLIAGAIAVGTVAAAEPSDETAVLGVIERMMSSFAAGDVPGVMETYRPEAVVVGSPGAPVTGEAALTDMFAGFVAAGFPVMPGGHEVIVAGDTALHLMDWRGQGPDGKPFRALSVAVLTRDATGEWRMVIDHPFGDGLVQSP
jgi:ketosteroid isomerase-like protein